MDFPLIRDNAKCIKCMRCIQICDKVQNLGVWDVMGTGSRTTVNVANGRKIEAADCSLCGQCITHCPVAALRERDDTDKVLEALHNPDTVTVVQVAPAVRAAWGEQFGLPPEVATEKRLATILRHMGVEYVFDTNFAADLTIMEEGTEFIERFTHPGSAPMPMFTSCCPGWMRFVKTQAPGTAGQHFHLQIAPADVRRDHKDLFRGENGLDPPENLLCVDLPCVAKKDDAQAGHGQHGHRQDVITC